MSSDHPLCDEKIKHYFVNVIPIQYLLSQKSATITLLCEAVQVSPDVANAVRVLSSVHRHKCRNITPGTSALRDGTDEEIQPVYNQLHDTLLREHGPSLDDAIAALLLVSSVLFDNGTGEWNYWLAIACTYLNTVFNQYLDISILLHHHQEPKFIFVLKTTFWFDVIASVTFNREPWFHAQIHQMFDPFRPHEHSVSMVDTIGCHNHVFWALSQTSWLSTHWNDVNYNLQDRCEDIFKTESVLAHHSRSAPTTSNDPVEISRFYTSQVFALTTRTWLETLKLGARPNVSSISDLIDETLSWFAYIPSDRLIQRHTVRSLVFCIFMMGILTTRDTHRDLLVMHLRCQSTDNIGNCLAIERVITTIWAQYDHVSRAQGRGAPTSVRWRDDLVSSGVLLV
ncbi:hypothetical protein ONZ45_g16060 [Pleurotus djamor]|nr:hypothetical protein ONZ45_g16060 [Pleurotus djamor]